MYKFALNIKNRKKKNRPFFYYIFTEQYIDFLLSSHVASFD